MRGPEHETSTRLAPERVATDLEQAGFVVTARLVRDPIDPEPQQQAYLVACKP